MNMNMMEIIVKNGDITKERSDAIVNPSNSYGSMGGGVALAILRAGGIEIEKEAIKKGPTPIGSAIATTSGRLPAGFVIHSPTMENPVERIGLENVERATWAALSCAKKMELGSVAFPGMGTGVGGVKKDDAARVMVKTIRGFLAGTKIDMRIILVGFDDELAGAFRKHARSGDM